MKQAKNTIDVNSKEVKLWVKQPNRYDIVGLDTIKSALVDDLEKKGVTLSLEEKNALVLVELGYNHAQMEYNKTGSPIDKRVLKQWKEEYEKAIHAVEHPHVHVGKGSGGSRSLGFRAHKKAIKEVRLGKKKWFVAPEDIRNDLIKDLHLKKHDIEDLKIYFSPREGLVDQTAMFSTRALYNPNAKHIEIPALDVNEDLDEITRAMGTKNKDTVTHEIFQTAKMNEEIK